MDDELVTSRKISQIIKALDEVQGIVLLLFNKINIYFSYVLIIVYFLYLCLTFIVELFLEFHQLANNYQVSQTINDTHTYLREMMKTISVKDNVLIDLQIIGDFSYAWYHIDRFTSVMQNTIKKEPSFVIKLRATFLKVLLLVLTINLCVLHDFI